MMHELGMAEGRECNPLDVMETVAALNDWLFERTGENEVTVSVKGVWCDYHIAFSWMSEFEALHMACEFDVRVPERREIEITKLLARVNEQLWLGHFDIWREEKVVLYRSALLLSGGMEPTHSQCSDMLVNAIEACERYYQAFQFVIWGGKDAEEALLSSLFQTVGQA